MMILAHLSMMMSVHIVDVSLSSFLNTRVVLLILPWMIPHVFQLVVFVEIHIVVVQYQYFWL